MEKKHFELTAETKVNIFGVTLFRIKATVKTKYANVGDIGGWVEKLDNLSGDAWVSGNAEGVWQCGLLLLPVVWLSWSHYNRIPREIWQHLYSLRLL